jgi:uncharacterized protein
MSALAKGNEPSMEEILASIRRIIADDQQAVLAEKDAPAPPPAPVSVVEPDEDVLDLAVAAQPLPPEPQEEPRSQDDVDLLFAEVAPEPVPLPAALPPPLPPQVFVAPAPVQPAMPEPSSDLMSAATSASIAGAFSSLSNTLLTGNARTLEDLVKDMMKPMLKTWLDDNLPTIVERLVKTEIERVARGGR